MGHPRLGRLEPNFGHRLLELLTVFGLLNGLLPRTDEFDLVLRKNPLAREIERTVQCGLAAHGGQQGIRPFFLNNAGDHLPGDGLDVGNVGRLGVGHDGGRVAVDQHHLKALLLERLTGLGTGVVKFAGLTDDNRACPDDENGLDIGALRHGPPPWPPGPSHQRTGRTRE